MIFRGAVGGPRASDRDRESDNSIAPPPLTDYKCAQGVRPAILKASR